MIQVLVSNLPSHSDKMQGNEGPLNNMSNTDNCENVFEPLKLDSTTSYYADFPIEILSSSSDLDNAQTMYKHSSSRGAVHFNDNQLLEERKLGKQRFWMIVRVLMRYLKKKTPDLHERARNVLGECAKRHVMKDEQYINLVESVYRDMILIVGVRFWERAEQQVDGHLVKKANERSQLIREEKLRKKRFWMQVRVLMRYLQKKHSELHMAARRALEDCEKRHVKKEERFINLVESVQRELTYVVGTRYWKRVELHVAKYLRETSSGEAMFVKEVPSFDSQEDDPTPLPKQHDKEPTTGPSPLKAAFSPPRYNNKTD